MGSGKGGGNSAFPRDRTKNLSGRGSLPPHYGTISFVDGEQPVYAAELVETVKEIEGVDTFPSSNVLHGIFRLMLTHTYLQFTSIVTSVKEFGWTQQCLDP